MKFRMRFLVVYILILITFLVVMVFSTNIVVGINNYQKKMSPITVNKDNFLAKDDIVYSLDNIVISEGILPIVACNGWSFCETSKENSGKKISLLFISEAETYKVNADVLERPDVRLVHDGMFVKGNNHGFYAKFSPITMKNGIYKLYLSCWENEENYGLEYTGKEYRKDYREFREWTWTSSKINKDFSDAKLKDIANNIDDIHLQENGAISIQGWAFIDGMDCKNQKVYLNISDSKGNEAIYNTQSIKRKDVGDAFKSSIYNYSGFKALIPSETLEKGKIIIQIYIDNEGTIYQASKNNDYTIEK